MVKKLPSTLHSYHTGYALNTNQKRVRVSENASVNLLSPEDTLSEDDWDTEAENLNEAEEAKEDYIDIEDILAPLTPTRVQRRGDRSKIELEW
jgi:hypothetical protein